MPARGAAGQGGAFLRQDASARAAGMAGAAGALADDAAALLLNPAGLARALKPEVSGSRALLFEDTSFDVLSAAAPSPWGNWGVSYARQSSGGFQRRSGPNDAPASFAIEQSAALLGWAGRWKAAQFGVAGKAVSERVDRNSASGRGVDAGVVVRAGERFALGLGAHNLIAPRITFVSEPIHYPRAYEATPTLLHSFGDWSAAAALRLARVQDEGTEWSLGAELRYGRLASLRAGWREGHPTAGFGLRLGNTSADYATVLGGLGAAHLFTLTQRFGLTKEELEDTIRRGIQKLTRAEAARLSRAYQQKAENEAESGRYAEALRDMEAAALLMLPPDDLPLRRSIDALRRRWEDSLKRDAVERAAALARREADEGDLLAARQYWRGVLELQFDHPEAMLQIARIDNQLSKEERARVESLRSVEEAGEVAQTLASAAALAARGSLRMARENVERALKKHPRNDSLKDYLEKLDGQTAGWIEQRNKDIAAAEAAGDAAEALRLADEAWAQVPANEGFKTKAESLRARLRESRTPAQRKQIEQLYYRAVERYLKGDYKSADSLADEIMKLDPGSEGGRALKEKLRAALRSGS